MKRHKGEMPEGPSPEHVAGDEEVGLAPAGVETSTPTQEDYDALVRERDELKDQLLRRRAEFENYKRRVERDRQQASAESAAAVLKGLVPSLDNLERALAATAEEGALRTGLELTHRELLSFLESRGVQVEDPLHQTFDPTRHQALSYEPRPDTEDGTIVEVLRKGYVFNDLLLRPALVKVAQGAKDTQGSETKH